MTRVGKVLGRLLPAAVLLLAAWMAPGAARAAEQNVSGQVAQVTLYRGQAMVTRVIPLEGAKGSLQIVVGDLPEQVIPESLFAEGTAEAEIRAVRFRTRAVGEEPRDEVRKLDDEIELLNEQLQLTQKAQELLAKRSAYLDQLEGFVAPTAKAELSKGVLDAEALKEVTLFSFEQRKEIATEQTAAEKEAKELNKQLSLVQRKRAELTSGASQTLREALVFVEKHAEAADSIRLSYLVSNCGWSPAYTFRAAADRKTVAMECNALIHQMTGEDWNGVELTLSTASPALAAAGPGLAPFHVTLTEDPEGKKLNAADLDAQLRSIRGRQYTANEQNRSALNLIDNIGSSWTVNTAANDFQCLELTNGIEVLRTVQLRSIEAGEGPSLSYGLAGPVSLASRADQQMVRILQTDFESRFYHVATPVLTSFVYREAELENTSEEDLLAGPVTVYLDGRFVGRGEIPTVTRGQKFVVGFGADPQLSAQRELADKSEAIQGGNRELTFQYRLVIENYMDEEVPLRVFDRLPYSDNSTDIRITLLEMEDPLSENPSYVRRERPKGILRWEITVPANAGGEKARILEYGYKADFDRKFQFTVAGQATPQQQQEFEKLQRARLAQ